MLMAMAVQADDYPYLAFQTSDGTVTTVAVASLSLTISDGQLIAVNGDGTQTFTLAELTKMYFTTEGTSGIDEADVADTEAWEAVYDLQGRRVAREQMRRGVYVVKSKKGTFKVSVK